MHNAGVVAEALHDCITDRQELDWVCSANTLDRILLIKHRDANERCVSRKICGAYTTSNQQKCILLLQKHRDANGSSIRFTIPFTSIAVRGRCGSPEWSAYLATTIPSMPKSQIGIAAISKRSNLKSQPKSPLNLWKGG